MNELSKQYAVFHEHNYSKYSDFTLYIPIAGNLNALKALKSDLELVENSTWAKFLLDYENPMSEYEVDVMVKFLNKYPRANYHAKLDGKLKWRELIDTKLRTKAVEEICSQLAYFKLCETECVRKMFTPQENRYGGEVRYVKMAALNRDSNDFSGVVAVGDRQVYVQLTGNEEELRKMQSDFSKTRHPITFEFDNPVPKPEVVAHEQYEKTYFRQTRVSKLVCKNTCPCKKFLLLDGKLNYTGEVSRLEFKNRNRYMSEVLAQAGLKSFMISENP